MSDFSHFNIVALPEDSTLRETFYHAAKILKPRAIDYLLVAGETLPHATLCQFNAENAEKAARLARHFIGQELHLKLTGRYVDISEGENEGKFWTGYIVNPEPQLMDLHMSILTALRGEGVEILGKTGLEYFPHFTLAQTNGQPVSDNNAEYDRQLIGPDVRCRIRLGLSDPIGQLLSIADGLL